MGVVGCGVLANKPTVMKASIYDLGGQQSSDIHTGATNPYGTETRLLHPDGKGTRYLGVNRMTNHGNDACHGV